MRRSTLSVICATALMGPAMSGSSAFAVTVNLVSSQDVTIYDSGGSVSNAAGASCFVGENAMGMIRRTLMRFDLSSIPAGSTVTGVTLTLNMAMSTAGPTDVTLQRLLVSWGEGTSLPDGNGGEGTEATTNDATWTHRFYNTSLWTTQGGDFSGTISATTEVDDSGFYNWSSAQMIADVQQWVNTPAGNFGWILRGDESDSHTSKRFDTRESSTVSLRPKLSVTYTSPCSSDVTNDNTVGVPDVLFVINAWGRCVNPNNCPADIAPPGPPMGNDIVGVPDLLEVINMWGPCP